LCRGLGVEPIDAQSCENINYGRATASDKFRAFLDRHGVPFERAVAANDAATVGLIEK
jgi:hypothetical protein